MSDSRPISELKQRMPAAIRRNQLLEVALEQFAARGYHDTSMDEVAEAAGVTKPVVYQHFTSKKMLYQELLDMVGQDLLREVATRAAAETNPYQRVLAGFRVYFRFVCERTSAFLLLFGSGARGSDDEFADTIRTVEESMAATIARFVDADIDAEHRHLLGYAIVGLGEVVGRRWVALHPGSSAGNQEGQGLDPAEAERLALQMADFVWAGLRGLPGNVSKQASSS